MVQNGGIRIDPKLLAPSSGQYRQTSDSARLDAALANQATRRANAENQDWDPVLRPVQQIFNALTAGMSGVQNAIDKGIKGGIEGGPIGAVAGGVGGLVNGFFASFNNDPNSENYMTGSKLLESGTDRLGNAYNPKYKDVADNVDPIVKAVAGFGLDVGLDPLTYVPGGIFISAARGAVRGAKAAEGLGRIGGAVKGVVQGVPDAVKLGRFTNTVKPIGLKQWKESRDYNKFAKIQRKAGLSEELMFAITAPNGVARFTQEILPQLRKDNGDNYLANLTPERVQEIANAATPHLPNYEKIATGAEGARAVAKAEAPPEGSVGYRVGDENGVKTPPVSIRESAAERGAAIRARLSNEKALSELEIRKFDTESIIASSAKKIDDLVAQKTTLEKSLIRSDKAARKADVNAQIADQEQQTFTRIAEIDAEIASRKLEVARQGRILAGHQKEWDTLAESVGIDVSSPDRVQSLAEHLQRSTDFMARTGIEADGILGLTTPAHQLLSKIDRNVGVSEGASQVLMTSLQAALKSGQIDDMIIGTAAGVPFGLRDAMAELYGTGSAVFKQIPEGTPIEAAQKESMLNFYSDVIDAVMYRMWDLARGAFDAADAMAAKAADRAGKFSEIIADATREASKTGLLNSQDLIHTSQLRLEALTALPAAQREMNAEEIKRLTAVIRQAEENVRWIENGGPDGLAPYVLSGGIDAAAEAARTAGFMVGKAGPKEAVAILRNVDIVRKAVTKINAEAPALESANGSVSMLLGKIIEAHSAMDESVKTIAALTGDVENPIKALIELVTGIRRPSAEMISNPETFGKLIIELAKLPIEIPGISGAARIRARSFVEAEGLGVYGVVNDIQNYGVEAYGRELLRNFQEAGAIVLEQSARSGRNVDEISAGSLDSLDDLVNQQAAGLDTAGESFNPNEAAIGFGLGEDIVGVTGDGPLGALDLFGQVVARGNSEEELLRNLEIHKGLTLQQITTGYVDNLEAAILGRKAHFSGETVQEFTAWWNRELDQFVSPQRTANVFGVAADATLRGKSFPDSKDARASADDAGMATSPIKRIIHNSDAELDFFGTRLFGDTPLVLEDAETTTRSILSLTDETAFKTGPKSPTWKTGIHAFYALMIRPTPKGMQLRARIANADTPTLARWIFDNADAGLKDARLVGGDLNRDAAALDVIKVIVNGEPNTAGKFGRASIPGFIDELKATEHTNIIDQWDDVIGGTVKNGVRVGSNTSGRTLMELRENINETVKGNISFNEGAKAPLPTAGGEAVIDREFRRLNPNSTIDVGPSQHILGYAKTPLEIGDWVRTIQLAASNVQTGGNFFGRYRAIAELLGIPHKKETWMVGGVPSSLAAVVTKAEVIAAHNKYLSEFERFVGVEKEAGLNVRVSEFKKSKGMETGLSKRDMGELRDQAASNYGVDPLGRTVRDKQNFTGGEATPNLKWVNFGWLEKFPASAGIIKEILSRSANDKVVLAALQNTLSEGDAALVIPLVLNTWGKIGAYGYTPGMAKALIDVRKSIAGSAAGIRAALEEMAPTITVTREHHLDLEGAVSLAKEFFNETQNSRWRTGLSMTGTYVPIGERIDKSVVMEMVNPQSRFGQAILSMDITPKGKAIRRESDIPEDEFISAMPDKQVEEVRDWATGGVKEEDIKIDNETVMFNSFAEVTVQEIRSALRLQMGEADALIRAAAARAKELTSLPPQKYAEQMLAAVTKKVRELDENAPKTISKWVPDNDSLFLKAEKMLKGASGSLGKTWRSILYMPKHRELLETVLGIAPHHASKVDELDNPIYGTSRYEIQQLKATKPVETLSGLIKSIEAITERHYGAPNSGMIEKLDSAGEVARLLQIDDAGHSNLIAASVNAKNVDQFFSQAQRDIINATKAVSDQTIIASDQIVAKAATITPEQQLTELAIDTGRAREGALAGPNTAKIAGAMDARMRQPIRLSIANATKKAAKKYNSFGNDTARTAMHDILQEIDRAARVLRATPEEIGNLKHYALMIYREEAQKLGLNPITSIAGNNIGRMKYSINADIDWAFIGYSDVITALRTSGKSNIAVKLLSEIMPNTEKMLRGVETGLIFPPNVVAEMGVLSMKLHAAGLTPEDIQATIYNSLIASVGSVPKGLFKDALEGVTFAAPTGANAARLAEYAGAFADVNFASNLEAAHVANGAYAYKTADEISSKIAEATLEEIAKVRGYASSSVDDIVQTIISSTPNIRRVLQNEGYAPDSFVASLAKGKVQQALNGAFTPMEIGIARTTVRTGQAEGQLEKYGITDNAKKIAGYRRVMSTERANLAAQRMKLTSEMAARHTVIRIDELIREATPESIQAAYEMGTSALELEMATSIRMAEQLLGGPAYAALQKTAAKERERLAAGIATADMRRESARQDIIKLRKIRKDLQQANLSIVRENVVSTIESSTRGAIKNREQLAFIDNELDRLQKMQDDIAPPASTYDRSTLPSDTERKNLSSYAGTGKGFGMGERFSGTFGKDETYHIAAARETSIDNNINSFEAQAEELAMESMRYYGVDVKRIPKGGLSDPELAQKAKIALAWGNDLMSRFVVKRQTLEHVLKGIKNPAMREMVTKYYELSNYILDKSGLIWQRAGLDSKWLNQFIEGGPFGKTQYAKLLMGMNGHKMHDNIVSNIEKLLEVETGAGGADWLTILKGYSWSLQRASMVPTLAADYSARFGNKARGLSHEEAKAKGWEAINTDGTLGQFIDQEQLYPPYYLQQLANMERFFNTDASVHAKWVRGLDKATGAIKSSITLWRPGHHVVNVMGETFMNVLAGVINPVRYAQAWKVMRSADEFGPGHIFGQNFTIPLDDFTNSYKLEAFTGSKGQKGVRIQVAGKERVIPFPEFYKMMNQKGILLNNNTAEDIIVQGDNILGSQNRMSGVLGELQRMNENLGAFSARRDNFFRIAHAIDIAAKKPHRSIPAMIDEITREVMAYHPTMQMLSPFERKYMRRVMFFYTWQRNAISVIMRTMLENPANFTILPKAIYEMSSVGGEPQSIGQPMPNDPRLAGFAAANNLGPHWIDEAGNVQGITLNAPQLDIFNTLMGDLYYDPTQDPLANVTRNFNAIVRGNTIGQAAPAIGIPMDYFYGSKYSEGGPIPINDVADYLVDRTGLGYISRATGRNLINNQGFLGVRSDNKTAEEQQRYGINALVGLRWTDWSKWYETAQRERDARNKPALDELMRSLGVMP